MSETGTASLANPKMAISPLHSILIGLVSAGGALGLGELLSGTSRKIPSLVLAMGDVIVDNTPGEIARWSIDTLGSQQKPALAWGITVVAILLGGLLGWFSRKRIWVAPAGLVVFGVVGGWAAARDPLSSSGLGWMSGLVSAAFGILVFVGLYVLAARSATSGVAKPQETSDSSEAEVAVPSVPGGGRFDDRRLFVGAVGTVVGASLFGAIFGRWLRDRDNVEGARLRVADRLREATQPTATATSTPTATAVATETAVASETPTAVAAANFNNIRNISPLITPNDDFYRIDTALTFPQVDPADWNLRIHGLVDREINLGFDDLLDLGLVEEGVTLSCVSNSVGGQLVGNAIWAGVPLTTVLDLAGPTPQAEQIAGHSVDNWSSGFPIEAAYDGRTALIAVQMNGEPLPIAHGFPARLVVAGLYGYVSATKWLSEIELTTWDGFDSYWVPRGWAKRGPIKTQSRIDVPRGGTVDAGQVAVAGVAWAPHRGVDRVEVQIGDNPWVEAELSRDTTDNSWRQWMTVWDATPGDYRIRVRATDGTGATQTEEEVPPAPDGATGWHTVEVRVQEA